MTRAFWIKLSCVILILFVLVGLCVLEDRLVYISLKQVNDYCYEIEKTIEQKGGIFDGEVASLVDNLEYSWTKNESNLCFMVNHKSIEQLGQEIVRLKTYIDENEPIEFNVSLEMIKHYVEQFQHFMGASFHNIL